MSDYESNAYDSSDIEYLYNKVDTLAQSNNDLSAKLTALDNTCSASATENANLKAAMLKHKTEYESLLAFTNSFYGQFTALKARQTKLEESFLNLSLEYSTLQHDFGVMSLSNA